MVEKATYLHRLEFEGKAFFSFNSMQKLDEEKPGGHFSLFIPRTQFHFKATQFEWMHINDKEAFIKGVGILNGEGHHSFLISASDHQNTTTDPQDQLRIVIQNQAGNIVYDNQRGVGIYNAPYHTIAMGHVTIHPLPESTTITTNNTVSKAIKAYPVPLQDHGIYIEIPEEMNIGTRQLSILNLQGRKMASKLVGLNEKGRIFWQLDTGSWPGGIYFLVVEIDQEKYQLKLAK